MIKCSDQHFSFKCFPNYACAFKVVRLILAAVSINGLNDIWVSG